MIRALRPDDAAAFVELRRQALLDAPLSFAASPGDDFVSSIATVEAQLGRAPEWMIFGAFEPELCGTAGLFRDAHLKFHHKAHLWGMYVAPAKRGRGLGDALLRAAILHALGMHGVATIGLSVSSTAPGARRLYERAGFQLWGVERDAMRHDGVAADEQHMALQLALS